MPTYPSPLKTICLGLTARCTSIPTKCVSGTPGKASFEVCGETALVVTSVVDARRGRVVDTVATGEVTVVCVVLGAGVPAGGAGDGVEVTGWLEWPARHVVLCSEVV